MRPDFVIGLDLAQSFDFTALVALERHAAPSAEPHTARYDVLMIERWRGRSYTVVPGLVRRAMDALRQRAADRLTAETGRAVLPRDAGTVELAVDATGVGAAVVDLLRDADLAPIPIVITGGTAVGRGERGQWHVPKADLVAVAQLLLEGRRLQIAASLPHAETLVRELQNFKYDYSPSGHMRFGTGGDELVWRGEGAHDDLILATAIAAWWAERPVPGRIETLPVIAGGTLFPMPAYPAWTGGVGIEADDLWGIR